MCQPTILVKEPLTIDHNQKKEQQQDAIIEKKIQNAKENLRIGTLYACISLVLLISAFSLVMPHLQSRRDDLQCDTLCQGSMTSARSTLSLIGSALMGRLSDSKTTRKPNNNNSSSQSSLLRRMTSNARIICLMVGTFATLIGFIIDASMYSIRGMWLSMIPGALLQQNFNIYKALLAEYHEEITQLETELKVQTEVETKEGNDKTTAAAAVRAGSVGKLGMSIGLAFMVGPLFGATLVKTYEGAVSLACCLTILSTIWIMKMPIPSLSSSSLETYVNSKELEKNNMSNPSLRKKIVKMLDVKAAKTKPALFLIVIRASMALAYHVFNTIWTVSLKRRFNFGPSDHGKFMSFIGLTFALSQGFLAKKILSPFGRKGRVNIILACCVTLGVGRVVAFQVNDLKIVYVMFGFIITSLGVVNTILTADTCLIAPSSEIGGVYGVLEAAQSAAGMVGPFVGGLLARFDPVQAPLAAIVGLYAFVFILVSFGYDRLILSQDHNKKKTNIDQEQVEEIKKEL